MYIMNGKWLHFKETVNNSKFVHKQISMTEMEVEKPEGRLGSSTGYPRKCTQERHAFNELLELLSNVKCSKPLKGRKSSATACTGGSFDMSTIRRLWLHLRFDTVSWNAWYFGLMPQNFTAYLQCQKVLKWTVQIGIHKLDTQPTGSTMLEEKQVDSSTRFVLFHSTSHWEFTLLRPTNINISLCHKNY